MDIFRRVHLDEKKYKTVGERRLDDAKYLLKSGENKYANGAVYLAGICVECLLKAQLFGKGALGADTDRESRQRLLFSHDLEAIYSAIPDSIKNHVREQKVEQQLKRLFAWSVEARYSPKH